MAGKKRAGTAKTGAGSKAEKAPAALTAVPEWASTTAVAKLLGKTTRRIQQLTQDGVLETEVPPGGGARKYKTAKRSSVILPTSSKRPRKRRRPAPPRS